MQALPETPPSQDSAETAFERRHGKLFPRHASVFCRQKQYYGVASCLQFIHPFLTTAAVRVTQAPHEQDQSVRDADLDTLMRTLYPQLTGAPASLNHEGPLAAHHMSLLQTVSDAQVFALFRSFQWVPASLAAAIDDQTLLFAEPSALMQTLWEPASGVATRYAAAIRAARADKPKYYRELGREGYLCEPGLHAERVFAPSLRPPPLPSSAWDDAGSGGASPANAMSLSLMDLPKGKMSLAQEAYWQRLVEAYSLCLPDRSHIHELENLPQEIAIGELLAEATGVAVPPPDASTLSLLSTSRPGQMAGSDETYYASAPSSQLDCVVDVGGGNAFLAAEVGERLGCDSMIIDPHYPPHSVDCCPRMWADSKVRVRPARARRFTIHRKLAFFKEIDFRKDIPAAPERCAFIAKHLCGTAVDECLRHLEAQNCWPHVLILVPCCFHKGRFDTYVNEPYLREVMHINSQEAYTRMTKLTDWNRSIYQRSELEDSGSRTETVDLDDTGVNLESSDGAPVPGESSRKRPRKSHHKARMIDHLVSCQEAMAASVEALMNRGRMLWLQARGYDVRLLEYVPDFVTPKNKCLVAVRRAS